MARTWALPNTSASPPSPAPRHTILAGIWALAIAAEQRKTLLGIQAWRSLLGGRGGWMIFVRTSRVLAREREFLRYAYEAAFHLP